MTSLSPHSSPAGISGDLEATDGLAPELLKRDPRYRRVFRGRASFLLGGTGHYWRARDHLLLVEVRSFSEHYTRFNLRDVQALKVIPNRHGWFRTLVGGLITLVLWGSAVGMRAAETDPFAADSGLWMGVAGLGALVLIPTLIAFRHRHSVEVFIQTAVQNRRLPGIRSRVHLAKFLKGLEPDPHPHSAPPST